MDAGSDETMALFFLQTVPHTTVVVSTLELAIQDYDPWLMARLGPRAGAAEAFAAYKGEGNPANATDLQVRVRTNFADLQLKYFKDQVASPTDSGSRQVVWENIAGRRSAACPAYLKLATQKGRGLSDPQGSLKSDLRIQLTNIARQNLAEYLERWIVDAVRPPLATDLPDPGGAAPDVKASPNVACQVYGWSSDLRHEIGSSTSAYPKASPQNHAERQWRDASGDGVGALTELDRVDLHISKQPCQYCAPMLIQWWGAVEAERKRLAAKAKTDGQATRENDFKRTIPAYVFTYADDDGQAHVFKLQANGLIEIGAWKP
jgi:hypothetical protein